MGDPREGRSATGTIVTGAAPERIVPAFRNIVSAVVTAAAPLSGTSWFLYGSLATGRATIGRSDVDLLCIGLPTEQASAWSAELSARFADRCRGTAIGAAAPDDVVGERDEAYGNRVFLRHHCVLRAGCGRHRPGHDFPAVARVAADGGRLRASGQFENWWSLPSSAASRASSGESSHWRPPTASA